MTINPLEEDNLELYCQMREDLEKKMNELDDLIVIELNKKNKKKLIGE